MIPLISRVLLWLCAGGATAMFGFLAWRRLFYPLELDCIEGVMMDHVVRLAHNQPIYVPPDLSFIPLAYMPVYTGAVSLLARFLPPDFWQGRLISLLGVIVVFLLIFKIVYAETKSWSFAAGGSALYLMAFGVTGSCYDVVRPDSLMLALALGGIAMLRFTRGQGGAVLSALLLTIAFFTKQHAVWFVLATLIHLALNERHRLLVFVLWLAIFMGGGFAAAHYWLGPWFSFYTFDVPSHWSQLSLTRILRYLGHNLFGSLGLLAGATLLSLGLPVRPWRGRDGIWMWVAFGALGTGLMATLDPSAYYHVLTPTVIALAILGPLSLHRIAEDFAESRSAQLRTTLSLACGMLALQFLPLVYPARSMMPHAHAAEARAQFVADLKRTPGNVLVPYHGVYSWLAGKGRSLHIIALDDIVRASGNRLIANDPTFLTRTFAPLQGGPRRPTIVTDVPLAQSGLLWRPLESAYAVTSQLGWISEPLRPVTGNRFTPTLVYQPKPDSGAALGQAAEPPAEPSPTDSVAGPDSSETEASVTAAHVARPPVP